MLRYLTVFLLSAFAVMQYAVWFGKNGVADWRALRGEIVARKDEIRALERRNDALKIELVDLQNGLEVVDERARNDLGLVGPGESFYQVVVPEVSGAAEPGTPAE